MTRQSSVTRLTVPVNEHDHILGPITAPITVVEYGDFECPYCGQAHAVVKQLQLLVVCQFAREPLGAVEQESRTETLPNSC